MGIDGQRYLTALDRALGEYRWDHVVLLDDAVDVGALDTRTVLKALKGIRRKRRFHELDRLASMAWATGHGHPEVRRQLAQGRIEQGNITTALELLRSMEREVEEDPREGPEVRGLIGRALKQRYVAHRDPADLRAAVAAYSRAWRGRERDHRWHGINVVALLFLSRAEGHPVETDLDPEEIARTILAEIAALPDPEAWDYATAVEAALALAEDEEALRLTKEYVADPDADAFELGSTLRQLREVWRAERTPAGAAVVKELEYQLLQREGAALELDSRHDEHSRMAREGFEAVYGPESYIHFDWLDRLYALAKGVARIHDEVTGEAWGTGFLVRGSALCEAWGEAPVLVTNAHVVSEDPADKAPLRPEEAVAEFTRQDGRPRTGLGEVLFTSPRMALDCTIVRVQGVDAEIPDLHFHRPVVPGSDDAPQRLYVMGHPARGELVISLHDNHLVGYEDPYVRYRSPTEGGSSGSPVLTRRLRALAVHHRKRDEMEANEGVLFEAIRNACTS